MVAEMDREDQQNDLFRPPSESDFDLLSVQHHDGFADDWSSSGCAAGTTASESLRAIHRSHPRVVPVHVRHAPTRPVVVAIARFRFRPDRGATRGGKDAPSWEGKDLQIPSVRGRQVNTPPLFEISPTRPKTPWPAGVHAATWGGEVDVLLADPLFLNRCTIGSLEVFDTLLHHVLGALAPAVIRTASQPHRTTRG